MEIIFNCSQCDQELSVDGSAVGTEIECPTCGTRLVVPEPAAEEPPPALTVNTIKTSAAAKEEHHFKVPVHETPTESLIEKPKAPLEFAAKENFKLRVKTVRHTDCIEVGHDRFDEVITTFLNKVGDDKIVSITPITYTFLDIGTQKLLTDFGVIIVYRT
jgi:DNA-directed RNA polymerase subunit RPC12/RpoP